MSKKNKVNEDGVPAMSVSGNAVPSLTNPTDAYALQRNRYKKTVTKMLRRRLPMNELKELPAKYAAGLTPAEIAAKKRHIKRNEKLSDRNPEAYKDMPGDKRIRAKGIPKSPHTIAYHAKFGEAANPAQQAAIAIAMKKAGKKPKNMEESAGLAAKASKSGVSLSILRKVYRRGVAAWNSGHRPGTTPQQWGMARVNSYINKGSGTYHGADKDLRGKK